MRTRSPTRTRRSSERRPVSTATPSAPTPTSCVRRETPMVTAHTDHGRGRLRRLGGDVGMHRGPTSGMAPGAHVIGYRVYLDQGCFNSDSIAAVSQAIIDDVDVIDFSIGGGNSAFTDGVELAFLDAYAAGILVNASAGNRAGRDGGPRGPVDQARSARRTPRGSTRRRCTSQPTMATGSTRPASRSHRVSEHRPRDPSVGGGRLHGERHVQRAVRRRFGRRVHRPLRPWQPGRAGGFRLQRAAG